MQFLSLKKNSTSNHLMPKASNSLITMTFHIKLFKVFNAMGLYHRFPKAVFCVNVE